VNLPSDATVDDVERIYFESWKLGLRRWRCTATAAS